MEEDTLDKLPTLSTILLKDAADKMAQEMNFSLSFGRQPKDEEEKESFIQTLEQEGRRRKLKKEEQLKMIDTLSLIEETLKGNTVEGVLLLRDLIRGLREEM